MTQNKEITAETLTKEEAEIVLAMRDPSKKRDLLLVKSKSEIEQIELADTV